MSQKRQLLETGPNIPRIVLQCELLELARSSWYYEPVPENPEVLRQMEAIDQIFMDHPYYGTRRLVWALQELGYYLGRDAVRTLMCRMGLEATYPKPSTTRRHPGHRVYPYLLRNVTVDHPDQVWSTDITYIPVRQGYLYLAAILDWHSRYVIAWRLSNSLEGSFCQEALKEALQKSKPEIFNSDQGCQFTAEAFTGLLETCGVTISMDGRGRALDNVFVERFWRSLKYENVYLRSYEDGFEALQGIGQYIEFYNTSRPHSALGGCTPLQCYQGGSCGKSDTKASMLKVGTKEVIPARSGAFRSWLE